MASIFKKLKNIIIGEDDYEDDYEESFEYEDLEEQKPNNVTSFSSYSRKSQSIGSISTSVKMGVKVVSPKTLDEVEEICADIKDKNIVIVKLEETEHSESQRISDFLCGAVYALEGDIKPISDKIIMITPVNIEIDSDLKDKLQKSGIRIPNSTWR